MLSVYVAEMFLLELYMITSNGKYESFNTFIIQTRIRMTVKICLIFFGSEILSFRKKLERKSAPDSFTQSSPHFSEHFRKKF